MDFCKKKICKEKKVDFIFNAVEDGWSVRKDKQNYVFSKNHNSEKEVLSETYLDDFIYKYITNKN